MDVGIAKGVLVGDLTEFVLLVSIDQVDEELLGPLELVEADMVELLVLGLFIVLFEALVTGVRVRLLLLGVNVVAKGHLFFLVVAVVVVAMWGGSHWRLWFFWQLDHFWRLRFGVGVLRRGGHGS